MKPFAIQTKYFSPTECKGARIKAWTIQGHSSVVPADRSGKHDEAAHFDAVKAMSKKYKWDLDISTMTFGEVDRGFVFTFPYATISPDTRLIKAAPDLLDALKFLLADYKAINGAKLTGSRTPTDKAIAAIKKAETK